METTMLVVAPCHVLMVPGRLKAQEPSRLQSELNQAEACDLGAESSGCWRQLLRLQVQVLKGRGIPVELPCPS